MSIGQLLKHHPQIEASTARINKKGERGSPCLRPFSILNSLVGDPLIRTKAYAESRHELIQHLHFALIQHLCLNKGERGSLLVYAIGGFNYVVWIMHVTYGEIKLGTLVISPRIIVSAAYTKVNAAGMKVTTAEILQLLEEFLLDQAEEGPTNFALMAYTSSCSSSSSSSDSEVSTCSKTCLKSYETLKEPYDNLTKDFNKSQLNVGAYKAGLESVEARLDVYKKNEVVFEEDIKILKLDIKLRDNALTELRKKFEKAEKERDDLKLTLDKFKNSSKNLSKLLEIRVSDKFKTGVGYDSHVVDSQVFDSQVFDSQVNDKHRKCEGYHAVPPPYTGNFMPPKPNLVLADEEEYVFSESITSVPAVATSEVKTIESKPKSVSEPLIEDWISNSEDENKTELKSKQRKPSFAKVEFVKSNKHVKTRRESVKKVESNKQAKYLRKNNESSRGNKRKLKEFDDSEVRK
ncbi:hypothetical protein Tco_0846518 [Tanacetum coccineum]